MHHYKEGISRIYTALAFTSAALSPQMQSFTSFCLPKVDGGVIKVNHWPCGLAISQVVPDLTGSFEAGSDKH